MTAKQDFVKWGHNRRYYVKTGNQWFTDKGATTDQAAAKAFTLDELKNYPLDGCTLIAEGVSNV